VDKEPGDRSKVTLKKGGPGFGRGGDFCWHLQGLVRERSKEVGGWVCWEEEVRRDARHERGSKSKSGDQRGRNWGTCIMCNFRVNWRDNVSMSSIKKARGAKQCKPEKTASLKKKQEGGKNK